MLHLIVGAYWGPRRETIAQCAQRLGGFLETLSKHDKLLSRWYRLISRKDEEKKEWDFRRQDVRIKILGDFCSKDRGRDLGFQVGLWNGQEDTRKESRAAGLSITCGLYTSHPGLSNVCLLDLPEALPGLTNPDKMVQILSTVVKHWEPDWGGVTSSASLQARNLRPADVYVDWIFFASKKLFGFAPLPQDFSTYATDDLGKIIVVDSQPVDVRKPEALARVESLEKVLGIDRLNQVQAEKLRQLQIEAMREFEQRRSLSTGDEVTPPPPAPI